MAEVKTPPAIQPRGFLVESGPQPWREYPERGSSGGLRDRQSRNHRSATNGRYGHTPRRILIPPETACPQVERLSRRWPRKSSRRPRKERLRLPRRGYMPTPVPQSTEAPPPDSRRPTPPFSAYLSTRPDLRFCQKVPKLRMPHDKALAAIEDYHSARRLPRTQFQSAHGQTR